MNRIDLEGRVEIENAEALGIGTAIAYRFSS
jgi:hypothetical protein